MRIIIIFLMVFVSINVFARGKRVRTGPTVEGEVQSCLENNRGMTIVTRKALNIAKNPLADRVESIQWPRFCECFGPQHLELNKLITPEFKQQQDWHEKYEAKRDVILVECANSNFDAKEASKITSSVPTTIQNANDSKFNLFISECTKNPRGRLISAQVYLRIQKNPRAEKVTSMDPKKYCECYSKNLRQLLGDELALQELMGSHFDNKNAVKIRDGINTSYEICAKEQIPF